MVSMAGNKRSGSVGLFSWQLACICERSFQCLGSTILEFYLELLKAGAEQVLTVVLLDNLLEGSKT